MSKFNKKAVSPVVVAEKSERTRNHEGAVAYKPSKEFELYSTVVTNMLSDKFYESSNTNAKRLFSLLKDVSPEFVAKLAVYTREKMYLRTIPLVLAVELAKIHRGDSLVSKMVSRVIQRPDEITEILAYYAEANNRSGVKKLGKLSNQIRVGVGNAFNKFNEYSFAKYNRDNEIKLRDALFLAHPKAKSTEQQELFDKIAQDKLETPYTWEVRLSECGKIGESKKDVWEELIDSDKVGYMALLRNLNNILQANVSMKHLNKVVSRISDENEVAKSKQLPFRFLSAFLTLNGHIAFNRHPNINGNNDPRLAAINRALNIAIKHSAKNIPIFDDEMILISTDVSGSMFTNPISPKSVIFPFHIGLTLAGMMSSKCKFVKQTIFGDRIGHIDIKGDGIIDNIIDMYRKEGSVGYSTNGYKVIELALDDAKKGIIYDKVMLFTDCQLYGDHSIRDLWNKYREKYNKKCKLYIFDLAGYGQQMFTSRDKGVYTIAGWSDKIFDMIKAFEGGTSVLDEIRKIEL